MAVDDRERCLTELQHHEDEIRSLSLALADLDRSLSGAAADRDHGQQALARHMAFINAQVMRHRISVALLESRLEPRSLSPRS